MFSIQILTPVIHWNVSLQILNTLELHILVKASQGGALEGSSIKHSSAVTSQQKRRYNVESAASLSKLNEDKPSPPVHLHVLLTLSHPPSSKEGYDILCDIQSKAP